MKNILNNKTKNPGLTLIEVIISVALLAILSLPVLTVINSNIKLSQKTEMTQQATGMGQRIIEYLNVSDSLLLDDRSALAEIGLNIAFDESITPDGKKVVSGFTELEDGLVIDIKLTEMINYETNSGETMTTNQFMQNPDFILSVSEADGESFQVMAKEDLDVFPFNSPFTANHLTLEIDRDQNAHLCQLDKETGAKGTCVSARLDDISQQMEQLSVIKIVLNGELNRKYEIPVINEGLNPIKIYVQTDTVSETNQFKFDREVDEIHKGVTISYLTKLPSSSTLSNLDSLYEIGVKITSSKVSGTLFEGQSMTNLKIEN